MGAAFPAVCFFAVQAWQAALCLHEIPYRRKQPRYLWFEFRKNEKIVAKMAVHAAKDALNYKKSMDGF